MNLTPKQGALLCKELKPLVKDSDCEVVVCVPATDLYLVGEEIKGSNVMLGAQNVHFEESGAFTGEISADMLLELGVKYVVLGHSERRQYFNDTDETVNKRTLTALKKGLIPIVCVGETLEERENNKTEEVLKAQIEKDLLGVEDLTKLIIAYEPIWAIGTGKTATSSQANETIAFIRSTLAEMFCKECASKVRILYGGSMKPSNAKELMAMSEIDGGLIGGASLKASDFSQIVNYNK